MTSAARPARVTVGVVSTAKYFAPRMLAAFTRRHPMIEMKLVVRNREGTVAAFADGTLDIAIMGRPPEGVEVESTPLGDHPHVMIAPPDHRFADATFACDFAECAAAGRCGRRPYEASIRESAAERGEVH